MSVAVVVPTIREECLKRWLDEWRDDLRDGARVIVVEDNPERSFAVPEGVEHYAWCDIDADLGGKAWIIPRRTSAVRSWGLLKAYRGGADVIWTLDDDCYPEDWRRGTYLDLVTRALAAEAEGDSWFNTIDALSGNGLYPRGYPCGIRGAIRPVMVHHGLWSNVPDLDGITQLANPDFRLEPCYGYEDVPRGRFFPMCVMNLAWRREMTPAMYLLLMGQDQHGKPWGFNRFDDIWAGLFTKRITDHLGYAVRSGPPSIHHSRASDPVRNAELEAPGIAAHEDFWPYVSGIRLTGSTVGECYRELARAVAAYPGGEYWPRLGEAMTVWASLFGGEPGAPVVA